MHKVDKLRAVSLSIIAASLAAAFGPVRAEDDAVARLIQPHSSLSLGLGYLTEDAARFGQYTGLREEGVYGIANVDVVRGDDDSGRWLRLTGRNLGLDSRWLRFEHSVQGDWKYFLEYDQSPRYSQYVVNSRLAGIGNDVVEINGAPSFYEKRLRTEREGISVGGQYVIGGGFDVQMRVKQETKHGARLFGERLTGAVNFVAEPIDHTMSQVDVALAYTGQRLQLTGGYYGSFFENDNSALRIAGRAFPSDLIALPPDNHAHQVYLSGGYSFTPLTRANFKLARSFAYQDDSFVNPSLVGRTDLGGELQTTLAQVGLSARPLQKLTLVADWRHEERDDQTPQLRYFDSASTGTFNGFNETRDFETSTGKLEARYMLPAGFKVTAGVDYDEKKRDVYDVRLVTTRKRTEETAYRVELARSLSDTVNGSISLVQSERTGSRLEQETSARTYYAVPYHLADRDRKKLRARFDWMPTEALSLQLTADAFEDDFKGGGYGVDEGYGTFWSIDGAYVLSTNWQASAWASRELARQENLSRTGTNDWLADLSVLTEAFGLGLRGTLGSKWKVGGDLSYSHNLAKYGLASSASVPVIDDVKYTVATLKLFTEYAMNKDLALRFDAIHNQWSTNDWLWSRTFYSDGTFLTQDETQETTFAGVSMRYTWR